MRIVRWLLLTAALCSAGCPSRCGTSANPVPPERATPGSARTPPAQSVGAPPADCDHPSTAREVFLAEYSIVYAVHAAVKGAIPEWAGVPLAQAVQWLRCDPDDTRRPGRIRYAVMKLAAGYVLLKPPAGTPIPAILKPMLQAIDTLIGPSSLVDDLSSSAPATLAQLEDKAGTIIDTSGDPNLVPLHRTCCGCIDDCVVGPSTGESLAEFDIKVNRDAPCLFHVVDPQCWSSVTSGYFNQVFVLGNAPPCTSGIPICRTVDPCDASQPAATPEPNPTKAGTPWCGNLYEDVTGSSNGVTAQLKNILKTASTFTPAGATASTATGFRMDYGLCESLYWQMCDPGGAGCQEGKCPIDRDCGHAWVDGTGVTGNAQIDGSKHIHFKSGLPHDGNLWAPLALEVLVKETAISACVPASKCPAAATPTNCIEPSGQENCTCNSGDHCVQQSSVGSQKPTLFCP